MDVRAALGGEAHPWAERPVAEEDDVRSRHAFEGSQDRLDVAPGGQESGVDVEERGAGDPEAGAQVHAPGAGKGGVRDDSLLNV